MAVFLLYSCNKNISRQWELSYQRLMALTRVLLGNVLVKLKKSVQALKGCAEMQERRLDGQAQG